MKVWPSDIIVGLSGRLQNIVFQKKVNNMHGGTKISARSFISPRNPMSIRQENIRAVTLLIIIAWYVLKVDSVAYATWQAEAIVQTTAAGVYISTYRLFLGFFLDLYSTRYSTYSRCTGFSNGTSLSWVDRDSRIFS